MVDTEPISCEQSSRVSLEEGRFSTLLPRRGQSLSHVLLPSLSPWETQRHSTALPMTLESGKTVGDATRLFQIR